MNELTTFMGKIKDIAENPKNYPLPQVLTAYQTIASIGKECAFHKKQLNDYIMQDMRDKDAKKAVFCDAQGNEHTCAIKPGKIFAIKDIEAKWKDAGFEPLEIGSYEFKASWTHAKALKSFGGEKSKLIDQLFEQTTATLEIK